MESRIMVVDDNAVNRRILSSMLAREGYECLEAEDGDKAVELARHADPDVILLDVMMPGRDGYSVCRELKQDPQFEHTPVLFLSSLNDSKDKIEGLDAGAVDFVTKPYNSNEVLARVRRNLSLRRRAVRERRRSEMLAESEQRLRASLNSAAEAQQRILPSKEAGDPSLEFSWTRSDNGTGISPEMFNLQRLDQRHICAWMVDVGGRGFGQGILATSLAHLLHPRTGGLLRPKKKDMNGYYAAAPEEVLSKLDSALGFKSLDSFFSIHYLLLDCETGILRFANIGRPDPLLLPSKGAGEWLEGEVPPPTSSAWSKFRRGQVQLEAGDRVYLLSDGVTLATGCCEGKHQAFSAARAEAVLSAVRNRDVNGSVEALGSAISEHVKGCGDSEDWTILGLHFLGKGLR